MEESQLLNKGQMVDMLVGDGVLLQTSTLIFQTARDTI